MKVSGLQIFEGMPFEQYLGLPGTSYSDIRHGGKTIEETPKMRLGTLVHRYILTPEEYAQEQAEFVKPLARELVRALGGLQKFLKPEIAVLANFDANGRRLLYRGRIDLCIFGKMVIDIKVTEKLDIAYFGYDCQLTGYARAINAQVTFILAIHPKTKAVRVVQIPMRDDWWDYQIYNLGVAC